MKKILVILMMALLCSTVSMAQNRKHSAKKPKANTERAMTEFEKQQKEELLNCLLIRCKDCYNNGDIEFAEKWQKYYEEVNGKNHYCYFRNVEFGSKEEKEHYGKMGIDTLAQTVFIKCGFIVHVHSDSDGKCVLHMSDDDITRQLEICVETGYLSPNTDTDAIFDELIEEINNASGYTAKINKKMGEIENFIEQHQVEANNTTVAQKDEQPNTPFSETSQSNRMFYQQHKSDYTKRQ